MLNAEWAENLHLKSRPRRLNTLQVIGEVSFQWYLLLLLKANCQKVVSFGEQAFQAEEWEIDCLIGTESENAVACRARWDKRTKVKCVLKAGNPHHVFGKRALRRVLRGGKEIMEQHSDSSMC